MPVFNKFYSFAEAVMESVHNFGSDSLKIAATNTAPSPNQTQFDPGSLHPPPVNVNGYPSGGASLIVTQSSQSGGLYKLIADDLIFLASGGALGPFRFLILYNDTAPNDELIGWWDYLASLTLSDGESLKADLDQINGVLNMQ
jgi:hypothetical protein